MDEKKSSLWTKATFNWSLLAILILSENASVAMSNSRCWNFDTTDGWQSNWTWSGALTPDVSNIPQFTDPNTGYMWLQAINGNPSYGEILTDGITLNLDDTITFRSYRHILYNNNSARPDFLFTRTDDMITVRLTTVIFNDLWEEDIATCYENTCCSEYPCTGYFTVKGSIFESGELLAVDYIGVNSMCDQPITLVSPTTSPPIITTTSPPIITTTTSPPIITTTTSPPIITTTTSPPIITTTTSPPIITTTTSPPIITTTTASITEVPTSKTTPDKPTSKTTTHQGPTLPPPESWCCLFEKANVCNWVLHDAAIGWFWSDVIEPASFPIPDYKYYIWEEDATAEVYSAQLQLLPNDATFSLEYFFNTQIIDEDSNYIQFSFASDVGPEIIWQHAVTANTTNWEKITLESSTGGICNNYQLCNGEFRVKSHNKLGNKQVAAITNFEVNNACA